MELSMMKDICGKTKLPFQGDIYQRVISPGVARGLK